MANTAIEEAKAAGIAHVAYAAEINQQTLPFETWRENKRKAYGGDDGVGFLLAEDLEAENAGLREKLVKKD